MLANWGWRRWWLRTRNQGNQGITALYLLVLVGGAQIESRQGWIATLLAVASLALLAWVLALRRRQAINDTPTSRIASAAQGYVELRGQGLPFDSGQLISPMKQQPCLWFRYLIEKRDHDNKWQNQDQGESNASFLLDDGSGRCVIDPEGAEISTQHQTSWVEGDYRYSEWLLKQGDLLYGLGYFRSEGGALSEQNADADLKDLLTLWKQDPKALRRRFDLDRNGELDEQEWRLVRQAAKREVARQQLEARQQDSVNTLRQAGDSRPYLLSNLAPEALARCYGLWALFHLLVFFSALAALPWMLRNMA